MLCASLLTIALGLTPNSAQPGDPGWETRVLLAPGSVVLGWGDLPGLSRIEDVAMINSGAWRAVVVDQAGARHVIGAPSTQAAAQLEAPLAGWSPLALDLSLEGDRLNLVANVNNAAKRAVFFNDILLAETGAALMLPGAPRASTWATLDDTFVTDDGSALILGTRSEPGRQQSIPTLALVSSLTTPPTITLSLDAGNPLLVALPQALAFNMNDLGHAAWIGNFATRRALLVDQTVVVRDGAPAPWPGSRYQLGTNSPVAINHQLEWALTTMIAGPEAKRHAIVKNGTPFLIHGQKVQFLSGLQPEPVQLFASAPLRISDDSEIIWVGQKPGATGLFRDSTCLFETQFSSASGARVLSIDPTSVQITRDGQRVIFVGRLDAGQQGLMVAIAPGF